MQSLTISIPAYNDSQSLVKLIEETQTLCSRLDITFELLIINDGSYDNTLSVSMDMAQKYGNIKIINHDNNLGFGHTLKEVFMLPKSEWVLFLPGDNQFPVLNLLKFLKVKDDYDFILGYRKLRQDSTHRKIYSFLYNWLLTKIIGHKVHDINGIAFYRSKIFDKIQLESNSAFVHAEFFIRTLQAGFRVTEIEVLHQEREFGFGAGGNITVMAKTLKDLCLYTIGKI